MSSAISTRALRKVYPLPPKAPPNPAGGIVALDALDLDVPEGEFFGVLGPNGAGKTTTIGILTTRVRISGGQAFVAGADVVREPTRVRRRIGVVPQRANPDRGLNVLENLVFHASYFGVPRAEATRRADALLERLGIAEKRNAKVDQLSGGQQQRLMIARALTHEPQIIFLDEPTVGLDPQARLSLWEILRDLHRQGRTIVMSTHYMEEADQLCDRVAIMDHGKVLALDTPAALKASLGAETIVTVTAEGDLTALAGLLCRDVDGVASCRQVEGAVVLHVKGASGVLPQVVTAAERGGFDVRDLSVAEPTLEAVFIHLTGRALR